MTVEQDIKENEGKLAGDPELRDAIARCLNSTCLFFLSCRKERGVPVEVGGVVCPLTGEERQRAVEMGLK